MVEKEEEFGKTNNNQVLSAFLGMSFLSGATAGPLFRLLTEQEWTSVWERS